MVFFHLNCVGHRIFHGAPVLKDFPGEARREKVKRSFWSGIDFLHPKPISKKVIKITTGPKTEPRK